MREDFELCGIVLRQYDCGREDLKLCIFTDKLGKIMVYAKGIKNPNNKNHAGCLCFCYSEFKITKNTNGMYTLCSAKVKNYFMSMSKSVEAVALGAYFCQCISSTFPEENPDAEALSLILNSLYALSLENFRDLRQIKGSFEFMLCKLLGFYPEVFECGFCGNELDTQKGIFFSIEESVILCDECAKRAISDENMPVCSLSYTVLCALRHIALTNTKKFLSIVVDSDYLNEFEDFCERYFLSVVQSRLDTLTYYKSLNRSMMNIN